MYKINENTITIDSLSLWIKREKVKIIDKRLTSEIVYAYIDIKELDEEIHPPKPIIIKKKGGITIRINLKQIAGEKYIQLTISAKMLKEKYFEGLTKENIKGIYKELMKLDIIKCQEQTFINANVNDIDICENKYIKQQKDFDLMTKEMERNAEQNVKYINRFNKEDNKGIEFNSRWKATISRPYIKIYFKELELKTKSKEFRELYIKEYEIKNLIRAEATIRNQKMIKRLAKKGMIKEFKTLKELLEIKKSKFRQIIRWAIGQYIKTNKMDISKKKDLTPSEKIIATYMQMIMQDEELNFYTWDIIDKGINSYTHENKETQKKGRYRNKQKLEKIIKHIKKHDKELKDKIETEQNVIELLEHFGIINK